MTRDIIEIKNFVVLIEHSTSEKPIVDTCGFWEPAIGFAFYGSGNVELNIHYDDKVKKYHNTKGVAMSFFANPGVEFTHHISAEKYLQCICILLSIKNIPDLPEEESEVFAKNLYDLVYPQENFVEGPTFYMNPDMQYAVDKVFNTSYKESTRMMFLRSQVLELVSHFIALASEMVDKENHTIKTQDREKLYQAKDIISQNLESPPSLNELSRLIGLNSYKLKKNFKELFGMPVFKYLQNERLDKAHHLLSSGDFTIQEAAWKVGYESLSSFSTAFLKKFGFRPSEVLK